ncbi:MAG: TerB N-terminal domain-containing protein [Kovacikia sp.]
MPPKRASAIDSKPPSPHISDLFGMLELLMEEDAFADEDGVEDDDYWVPPGETVNMPGYTIPGMVYFGDELTTVRGYGIEPCLLRPGIRVSRKPANYEKSPTTYSLSYTQMQPECRAAYLRWLSEGRCAPKVYSGYLWLFFYGLERRVLHGLLKADLKQDEAKRQELDQIIAEVQRLKALYGDVTFNGSFQNKANLFLEICRLIQLQGKTEAVSPGFVEPIADPLEANPFTVQLELGYRVNQGQPIPAEWALAWYVRLANHPLPTSASRCLEEFKTLFQVRYQQAYGEGLKLKAGKVPLKTNYYPANPSFGRAIEVNVGDLPDVSRFTAKVTRIGELVQQCRLELDPLSRLLGRNPSARHSAAAIALLPTDILLIHGGEMVTNLQKWLTQHFAQTKTQIVTIPGQELLQYWSGSNPEKLTKAEATGFSQVLEQLGYGMEPDPRFEGSVPTLKTHVALFRLPQVNSEALPAEYSRATLLAHLAIATASGDELPSPLEQRYLQTHLSQSVPLEEPQRSRLNAHLFWLLQEKPTLRNLKARIERVNPEQREDIAHFLVEVAAADGQLKPKEVQLLEKAYSLLGLEAQAVYSDIHHLSTNLSPPGGQSPAASEPVTVRKASPTRGHKIPSRPKPSKNQPETSLDMALVQSKLQESQEISNLLAEIFVEDESTTTKHALQPAAKPKKQSRKTPKSTKPPSPIRQVAGLDSPHTELLFALEKRAVWQREEVAAIATKLELMLDGALEMINEAAFETCDEPVIEGDDCLEVNVAILQKLLSGS